MGVILLFGVMLLLLTLSVPIGLAVGGATILTFLVFSEMPMTVIAQYSVAGLDSFPIMAIPFFIMAGTLMSLGGIARRIVDTAAAFVGFVTGGLGAVVAIASMFFAAISGSAVATVAAIGGFMVPEMTKKGYAVGYSAALTACAGTVGVIIPPSVPLVIFGVVTQTSIGDLFIAGIIPGICICIGMVLANYICCKKNGFQPAIKRYEKGGKYNTLKMLWEAKWALFSPFIILGGIYGGIFTPTEAAVVSVVYSVIVSLFIYKELNLKGLYDAIVDTAVVNGITSYLLGVSSAFAAYLSLEKVPALLFEVLTSLTENKYILLIIINLALLIIGMFVDNIPATIIISPILLPVVTSLGMSPITFGIMLTINLTIGLVTPPYGCNLFVAGAVAGIKMENMVKYLWPFLIALTAVLFATTYIPQLTMILLHG